MNLQDSGKILAKDKLCGTSTLHYVWVSANFAKLLEIIESTQMFTTQALRAMKSRMPICLELWSSIVCIYIIAPLKPMIFLPLNFICFSWKFLYLINWFMKVAGLDNYKQKEGSFSS